MSMPNPVCRTSLNNKWLQYEVCRTFLGRGMGMNITAHIIIIIIIIIITTTISTTIIIIVIVIIIIIC